MLSTLQSRAQRCRFLAVTVSATPPRDGQGHGNREAQGADLAMTCSTKNLTSAMRANRTPHPILANAVEN